MDWYLLSTVGMMTAAAFVGMWAGATGRKELVDNAVVFIFVMGVGFVATRTILGW